MIEREQLEARLRTSVGEGTSVSVANPAIVRVLLGGGSSKQQARPHTYQSSSLQA
jgi:hypothetical protein